MSTINKEQPGEINARQYKEFYYHIDIDERTLDIFSRAEHDYVFKHLSRYDGPVWINDAVHIACTHTLADGSIAICNREKHLHCAICGKNVLKSVINKMIKEEAK